LCIARRKKLYSANKKSWGAAMPGNKVGMRDITVAAKEGMKRVRNRLSPVKLIARGDVGHSARSSSKSALRGGPQTPPRLEQRQGKIQVSPTGSACQSTCAIEKLARKRGSLRRGRLTRQKRASRRDLKVRPRVSRKGLRAVSSEMEAKTIGESSKDR